MPRRNSNFIISFRPIFVLLNYHIKSNLKCDYPGKQVTVDLPSIEFEQWNRSCTVPREWLPQRKKWRWKCPHSEPVCQTRSRRCCFNFHKFGRNKFVEERRFLVFKELIKICHNILKFSYKISSKIKLLL